MNVLLLSPHRDDAAFSCGLFLSQLLGAGVPVDIVNVCTVSDYAPYAESFDGAVRVSGLRAAEDEAFVAEVNAGGMGRKAKCKLLDLGWSDAPLRRAMATEDVLNGAKSSVEEVERLAEQFRKLPRAQIIVAPLAVGGGASHMDHRLVRDAAIAAWNADRLLFYEDLPYACRMDPVACSEETGKAAPWPTMPWHTAAAPAGAKHALAMHYGSQIAEAVAAEMETYGAALGCRERLHGAEAALETLDRLLGTTMQERSASR